MRQRIDNQILYIGYDELNRPVLEFIKGVHKHSIQLQCQQNFQKRLPGNNPIIGPIGKASVSMNYPGIFEGHLIRSNKNV